MSKRSRRYKRQGAHEKRRKNRWELVLKHANECSGKRIEHKNWGFTGEARGENAERWFSARCCECHLRYKVVNGRMKARGVGSFTLPLDLVTLLGMIGET